MKPCHVRNRQDSENEGNAKRKTQKHQGCLSVTPTLWSGKIHHSTVQLTPLYRHKLKRSKSAIRSGNTRSKDATETLNGCFEWSVVL